MNGDAAYTVFFGFGIIWVLIGIAGVIALLKSDNQPIRLGKWGLTVAIPILIPFITVLLIAMLRS